MLWLVASVGKVVLCESLSSSINIIPSCDNDNYARRRGDLVQVTDQYLSLQGAIIGHHQAIVDVKMYLPVPLCPQTWSTFEPRPPKLESPAFPAHR